jgi:hypothetical protein
VGGVYVEKQISLASWFTSSDGSFVGQLHVSHELVLELWASLLPVTLPHVQQLALNPGVGEDPRYFWIQLHVTVVGVFLVIL